MYYIDSSPREPRFVLVPLRFASEAWPRAGLGLPRSASNANKPASSWPLKQGRKKCSKHGCDRGTSTVGLFFPSCASVALARSSHIVVLLNEMAWTDPRSHVMPLAVPLTPNPLAGRKFYYVAGEMPPTSKLQILLSGTKCH